MFAKEAVLKASWGGGGVHNINALNDVFVVKIKPEAMCITMCCISSDAITRYTVQNLKTAIKMSQRIRNKCT